jgi:hypothetical protein
MDPLPEAKRRTYVDGKLGELDDQDLARTARAAGRAGVFKGAAYVLTLAVSLLAMLQIAELLGARLG